MHGTNDTDGQATPEQNMNEQPMAAASSPFEDPLSQPSPYEMPVPPIAEATAYNPPEPPVAESSPYEAPPATAVPPAPESDIAAGAPGSPKKKLSGRGKKSILFALLLAIIVIVAVLFLASGSASKPAGVAVPMSLTAPMTPPGTPAAPAAVPTAPAAVSATPTAPVVAPAAPTAAPAPVVPAPAPAAPVAASAGKPDACEQRMIDYANANHADAKAYVAQNQAYLVQCRAALGSK